MKHKYGGDEINRGPSSLPRKMSSHSVTFTFQLRIHLRVGVCLLTAQTPLDNTLLHQNNNTIVQLCHPRLWLFQPLYINCSDQE